MALEQDDKLKKGAEAPKQTVEPAIERPRGAGASVKERNDAQVGAILQPPGANVSLQKGLLHFRAEAAQARTQIQKVQSAMMADEHQREEAHHFAGLLEKLQHFEHMLIDAMDEAKAPGGDKAKAKAALAHFLGFVTSDPVMHQLGANPIAPSDAQQRLSTALHQLEAAFNAS